MDLAQRWAQAGLADDFIFSKVMVDPQICREVIQRILPDQPLSILRIILR